MQSSKVTLEFSAGGVVVKHQNSRNEILVVKHGKYGHWSFPKGHIGDKIQGESKETAALREVKEETGTTAEILEELKPETYWYQRDGEKRKKTVYFFLMRYVSGNTSDRDHEMEEVEWLPDVEVLDRLTYPSDKAVWQEAQKLLASVL